MKVRNAENINEEDDMSYKNPEISGDGKSYYDYSYRKASVNARNGYGGQKGANVPVMPGGGGPAGGGGTGNSSTAKKGKK